MSHVNIIGSGILGASTAYELTRRGHKVTIADNGIDGRATSAAAGIISPWVSKRRNMAWYALAKGGAAYYPQLTNQLQQDGETNTGYRQVGSLRLHHDKEKLMEFEKIAHLRQKASPEMGEVKLLDPEETHAVFPYTEKYFHGLYISGAARVDGHALRNALLNACKKRGVSFVQGTASINFVKNRITGMTVNNSDYPADVTIAANGVWMNDLLGPLQPRVHFQAQKGELLHLQTNLTNTADLPVVKPPNNQYILPLNDGRLIAGATHQTAREPFDTSLTAQGTHYILDQLLSIVPSFSTAQIVDSRIGFRPFTKNHLPVFGSLPNYHGLMIANGLGASGLTTAPFIGKQLAKKITGEKTDVPLSDYHVQLAE